MRAEESPRRGGLTGLCSDFFRGKHPATAALLIVLFAQLPLHWEWILNPENTLIANPFSGTHVWAVDHLGNSLWSGHSPFATDRVGHPVERNARFIGWAFLLPGAMIHPILSGIWSVHAVTILGPALGAAVAVHFFRLLNPHTMHSPLIVAGIFFGLAPVTLGAALSGQIENTQSWILPLLLWVILWSEERRERLPWVAVSWLLGALTSPYLAMGAALALPWLLWGHRSSWRATILAVISLSIAGWWLSPAEFDSALHIFKPAYGRNELPNIWATPIPIADLDSLFSGTGETQPRHSVLHQPYLGLVLIIGALLFGSKRKRWAWPITIGVIVAMGPTLAWYAQPVELQGREVWLPARVFQWLNLPPAQGGQYYRFILLAHLGFAGVLASSRFHRLIWICLPLGLLDVGRSVAPYGIPWPTKELPTKAWNMWNSDQEPGAIIHVPMLSPHTIPCNPFRLSGQGIHDRSLAALPRGHREVDDTSILGQLDRCTRRGQGCPLPSLAEVGELGFRYVVLDLPDVPERTSLRRRLESEWGPHHGGTEDLIWWIPYSGGTP